MATIRIELTELLEPFEQLEDPRASTNQKHPLVSVIMIGILATLAGANGPTAIAVWANSKTELLKQLLPLPHGIPAKDCIRRVFMALAPLAFQACFENWLTRLTGQAAKKTGIDQPVFAIDGKTNRRSHDKQKGLAALHSVSVWASEYGLSLGQVAVDGKSNEITAIPELLRLVNMQGAIITIDAMGTQVAIAEQIIDQGGDYLLALKGNQGSIHQAAIKELDAHLLADFADITCEQKTTEKTAHGRHEIRHYVQIEAPETLAGFKRWSGLQTIGMAMLSCERDGKETYETRYFLSSLPLDIECFARSVRSHWGIENGLHWTLDVTYREDESRIRDENARENFAWLNRFTLSLLKQHPKKQSVAMKRRLCGWNDGYLLEVLTSKDD